MINEQDKERLRLLVIKELKENADLFDLRAEIDSSLSYEENKNIILDKIDMLKERDLNADFFKEQQMLDALSKSDKSQSPANVWRMIHDKVRIAVILADTGEGKTALAFKILQAYDSAKVYFFKHPKPHLIQKLGYKNLNFTSELATLTDCVVFCDEPQLHFERGDKKSNQYFEKLATIARQNGLTLLFSTSDSRWINKGLEAYVSHWVIKSIDINLLKQGSMAKKVIQQLSPLSIDDFTLPISDYLLYSRKTPEYNGRHSFSKPIYFNDELSKAYKNSPQSATESAEKIPQPSKEEKPKETPLKEENKQEEVKP